METATMDNNEGSANVTDVMTTRRLQSKEEIASQAHWIISLIVSFIIIFINLWIAIAFYHHVITTKVLKKKKSRRDVNGGLVMIMALAAVVMPFVRYLGTLFFLFVSLYQEYKEGCELANDVCVVGFGIALLPSYAFLWARQRAFYGHPSLGHMFGRCVSVFSHLCIVLIVLLAVCALGLGVYPDEYEPKEGGCHLKGGVEEDEYRTYIYATIMITSQLVLLGLFLHPLRIHAQQQKGMDSSKSIKSEGTELSSTEAPSSSADFTTSRSTDYRTSTQCFTDTEQGAPSPRPIRSKRSQSVPVNNRLEKISKEIEPHRKGSVPVQSEEGGRKKTRSATVYDNGNRQRPSILAIKAITTIRKKVRKTTMRSKRIYRLIKRVLYLTIISVCSDLIIMVLNAFVIPDNIPQTYSFVMYDFSLLINVTIVIFSFENWRVMMLSPITSLKRRFGCATQN